MNLPFALLFVATALAAEDDSEPRPQYCEEPKVLIRGEPEKHDSPRDEDILNPEEKGNPELARRLAATPGPYGHSELGFRYLARLFGYPGRFGTKDMVEEWIVLQEAENRSLKQGLWELWEKWAIEGPKRLAVPQGKVRDLPEDANPNMFFLDLRDRLSHANCLKTQLAIQLCWNYSGRGRPFADRDVLLFPKSQKGAEKYAYCQVRVPPWRKEIEAKAAKEAVSGSKLGHEGSAPSAQDKGQKGAK